MIRDQKFRVPLRRRHPAKHLRHDQTHVMVHAEFWPDISRRGHIPVMTRQQERDQRIIQVDDRRQGVEGSFCQRSLRTCACRRRRLAGHAANELHEQLRQFHVMDRVVARQGTDAGIGGIVPAARQHRMHRCMHRLAQRHPPLHPRRHLRRITLARIADQIGSLLQVARIFCRFAVHHSRMRRGDEKFRLPRARDARDQLLHRFRIFVEPDRIFHQIPGVLWRVNGS